MELLWWVMDYFKVLPTEERFLKLTSLQISFLAAMRTHALEIQQSSHEGAREEFYNPQYEQWEKEELERLAREKRKQPQIPEL